MKLLKASKVVLALSLALLLPATAHAYIGPGTGLSAIGSILAFLSVIVFLIAGFVWFPVKRLLRNRRSRANSQELEQASDGTEP